MHDTVTIMKNINIGIIGITGYTGIELIKTLNNHPLTNIVFVGANVAESVSGNVQ